MLSLEKHGKECNLLEKLAAQVKTAIAAGGGSKEREDGSLEYERMTALGKILSKLASHVIHSRPLTQKPGYERWLFMAWVWGDEDIFAKLSARVVMEAHIH